jgi:hypothetical protein
VQSSYGDHGPGRRCRRERRVLVVALPEGGQEARDVGLGHLAQAAHARGAEVGGVPAQVPAVGRDRVGRQPPLDGQVVQIAGDDPLQRGSGSEVRGQRQGRTSWSGTGVMPWASATSGSTTCPAATLTPWASAGLLRTAAAVPSLASAMT